MEHMAASSASQRPFLLALLLVLTAACISSGCFITNCPPGGKRSGPPFGKVAVRQCASCGYGGRCFGPSICCSPTAGCLVADGTNSALLRPCTIEAVLPGACESGGKRCGAIAGGRCAAKGICCDDVSCSMDSSCLAAPEKTDSPYSKRNYGNSRDDFPVGKTYADNDGGMDRSVVNF
ncbi:vasotocin-neurophysin VT-like [Ischnura elegans]|uniref:vasotocin-neurophysin VT-like n=1 Tax=Ischnura elegans TaxID=197161 RepID=UPI001ED8AAE2|nr:vasotocin-neurophysin VT-like [Ischnura elegans]